MSDQPDSMLVHCGSCKHEWFALKLPMLMRDAAEKIMTLECPHCTRRSKIYCGPAPVGEKTTDDLVKRLRTDAEAYRQSLSAPDTNDMFSLAYQWQDKKHRHVWDLCGKLEIAADRIEKLEAALEVYSCSCSIADEDDCELGDWANISCGYRARKALDAK